MTPSGAKCSSWPASHTQLPWHVLGAIPEMLQTAYGSLTVGLNAQPGQSLLIRGGSSSVGLTTAVLAKALDMTVVATTRNPNKIETLKTHGVDHAVIDHGSVAEEVRRLTGGVDAALELVGTPTLPDTLRATRVHGMVCFTGMLSNQWTVPEFYPIDYIPRGVRLTSYAGEAADLPPHILQGFLDNVAGEHVRVPIDSVFTMAQIKEAHALMESGRTQGKLVVLTRPRRAASTCGVEPR